jgi:hypothetical protein
VTIKDHQFWALLDTGAGESFINTKVLEKLGVLKSVARLGKPKKIKCAVKKTITVIQEAITLPIQLGKHEINARFLVEKEL